MNRPRSTAFALTVCAALLFGWIVASCGGSSDDGDPSATDSDQQAATDAEVDTFFQVGQSESQSPAPGETVELPGGGSIGLPRSSPEGVEISVAEASLTADAAASFQQWNPGEELQDSVTQVTLGAGGDVPEYLIARVESPDDSSRIFVAGSVDDDTEELAWTPLPTYYDDVTGEAIAAVGIGEFASDEAGEQTYKLAARRNSLSTSYRGYIAVAIGGRPFRTDVFFEAVDPLEALEAEFGSEPIQVSAVIGLSLTAVTEEPLATMTVQSPFGQRGRIQGAPRASRQHKGTDYVATTGTTVFAAGDGVVSTLQWQNQNNHSEGAGYYMKIDHGGNEFTSYFHLTDANAPTNCDRENVRCCTDLNICEGARVTAGQAIASSDNTGHTSGPHLHFEVRDNGHPIDPELIFDERIETTIAMAVDFEVQDPTKTRMNLTFGAIEQDDLQAYANEVAIDDLQPGEHTLQFVAIEPGGTFEILGEVPLTITGPFTGVTGSYTLWRDTEYTAPDGDVDTDRETLVATFDLVAVGENRLEGPGHVEYVQNRNHIREDEDCGLTSSIASVEWDVFFEGEFSTRPDGTIDVQFTGDPPYSPDYVFTQTSEGGCNEFTDTLTGTATPIISVILTDGEYYFREDSELGQGETGEDFFELIVEARNHE